MRYQQNLDWLFAQSRAGAPRDPARMTALVQAFGLAMPTKSVHIVGSNGKGSTSAMIAAGLEAAGVRTGLFLSPHVEDFRERISVNGRLISEPEVLEQLRVWRRLELPLRPGFFEWCFALALEHFARQEVACVVVEAGIGAARDVTLILENVAVSVLTSVSLEHQELLGSSLAEIARDKAAAIRAGTPLVTAVSGEALEVVRAVAAERRSPLYVDDAQDALFSLPAKASFAYPARLRNARLAAASLRLLGAPESAVAAGLASPPLPARREAFHVGDKTVLLDGAHNPSAHEALLESLPPGFTLLFGALPRKQGEDSLRVLGPQAAAVFVTDAGGQASILRAPGRSYVARPRDALEAALEQTPAGGTLLITGSFYLAGELRPLLRARASEPG